MSDRESDLAAALAGLRDRLTAAAQAAGRDAADVELLPITKFFPASDVAILWRLGCRSFGESRDQEASAKVTELQALTAAQGVRWHMVGQIQRNKAKHIAAWADTVHSLSAPKVVTALDRGAQQAIEQGLRTGPVKVFVQISLDGDTERGGVDIGDPAAVDAICDQVADAEGLSLIGLMASRRAVPTPTPRSRHWPANTAACCTGIRRPPNCPPGCPVTWKPQCDTVRRVCVSVQRFWDNVL